MLSKIISLMIIFNTIKISMSKLEGGTEKLFGRDLLNLFYLDPEYVNVNHGSYGSPPKMVVAKYREYQEQMDFNPEKWIRYELNDKVDEVRAAVANYVNADVNNIVLIENASDGINSVFKSILVNRGSKILMFDIAYTTAKNTAKYLVDNRGVEIVEVQIDEDTINADDDYLLKKIKDVVNSQPADSIKLASIDHISSIPAVLLPIKKIIKLLKSLSIPIFIDGAHAVGQIPLDMRDLDPDFYISNFHKWAFNPKSASFLYVSPKFQNRIHPNIISSGYGKGFVTEFSYTGTKDYSSYLTIKDALNFRQIFGETTIMDYIRNLAAQAGDTVANMWGTDVLIKNGDRMTSMVNVRIPSDDSKVIEEAAKRTLMIHNTFIPVFKFSDGKFYARFSAQIYNQLTDYIYAAEKLLHELKNTEVLKFNPRF